MVVSERSLKRVRDFFNISIKVKHRYNSLKSFLDNANELEQAEFYEEHFDTIFVFLFECFLLMISKTWILEGLLTEQSPHFCTFKFAFGVEEAEAFPETTVTANTNTNASVKRVMYQCQRISPTNSTVKEKWFKDMKAKDKDKKAGGAASMIEDHLKFPVIFKTLLQFVSISRLMASPLAKLLILMIKRLLQEGNVSMLRVEGLKMLLNFLKASSYEDKNEITEEFIKIFKSLVNLETIGIRSNSSSNNNNSMDNSNHHTHSTTTTIPLIREDVNTVVLLGVSKDFEILNEIFAFITWDLNPDSHSTKFLYELLRDGYLSRIYPISYKAASTIYSINTNCDLNVPSDVQELVIDYVGLWLLKSESRRSFKFGGSSVLPTADYLNGKRSESMVSLAVNDLTNLFGGVSHISSPKGGTSRTSITQHSFSQTTAPASQLNDAVVAGFLLEEIILNETVDVVFIHSILRSALLTLPFISKAFSIKLVLEIFRSWLFNPPARRPEFLKSDGEIEKFVGFYLDSLSKIFPNRHRSVLKAGEQDDDQLTLFDRLDLYREVFYFFRAVALQAYSSLSLQRWVQLLKIEIEVAECLLSPENMLERPVFTLEDALISETILGSLVRSAEYFHEKEMKEIWIEASRVLTRCCGCRGVIEEWSRIVETLAIILVKDSRFTSFSSHQLSRAGSNSQNSREFRNQSNTNNNMLISSSASLPPITASFSAWPDLPSVKSSSVLLFRNVLRILGDPTDREKKLNPEMVKTIFEALHRCTEIFLKCRASQATAVPSTAIPPLIDILPAALSCLLNSDHLKFDDSRILAYKIVGRIMFRVDDLGISRQFWGTLLLILKRSLDEMEAMSVGQFTALLQFIGLPLTSALIPGTTLILNELINSILRFYNNSLLWSTSLTASEAEVLIPTTMKIIANAIKLSKVEVKMFDHFRDPDCFIRMIKMFLNTLTDPKLLTIIYCTISEIYCGECAGNNQDLFSDELLELILGPFKSSHLITSAVVCVCEYISMLAHLKVSHVNIQLPINRILDAFLTALESVVYLADLDLIVVQIVQGPLSDIILYCQRGIFPDDEAYDLKNRFFALFDANWASKHAKAVIEMFVERLLTFSQVFPGHFGPSLVGSYEDGGCTADQRNRQVLLQIAISPSSTLLSFECDNSNEDKNILMVCRNSIGKFIWKLQFFDGFDITSENENSTRNRNVMNKFSFPKVDKDEEFPFIHRKTVILDEEFELGSKKLSDFESQDVLKQLLNYLKKAHPETVKKHNYSIELFSLDDEKYWKTQCGLENEFVDKRDRIAEHNSTIYSSSVSKPAAAVTQISQLNRLRILLSSFGIVLPEMYCTGGVELLKSSLSSASSSAIDEDLKSLDSISGRVCIKVGSVFIPTGVTTETDLLNYQNQNNFNNITEEDYSDFLSALAIDPKVSDTRRNFGYFGGIKKDKSNCLPLPYLGTPTYELIVHELDRLKEGGINVGSALEVKRHIGNDTILILWHESDDDCIERCPLVSDVTSCIIRIRPHPHIPGWYCVTVQNCFERLVQPRKFARLRTDPFVLKAEDSVLHSANNNNTNLFGINVNNSCVNDLYDTNLVQGRGVLVSKDLLGPMVRSLVVSSWKEANLIDCIRSKTASIANSSSQASNTLNLDSERRVEFAPEMVRKDRIREIIQRHAAGDVTFDGFLSKLFS